MSISVPQQFYTLYDVTGLIDKDKRIYYVPLKSELVKNLPMCESFMDAFSHRCPPPSSEYKDVEITSWNPRDRVLVVKGNIDLFTKGSSSYVFNYVIIKRSRSSDSYFYDSFFIRSAMQTGLNSVRLTLESDEFTNAFFLHNDNIVSETYEEPFNNMLKNCFVERQHYNRLFERDEQIEFEYDDEGITQNLNGGTLYLLKRNYQPQGLWLNWTYVNNSSFACYRVSNTEKTLLGYGNKLIMHNVASPTDPMDMRYEVLNDDVVVYSISKSEYDSGDYFIGFELENNYTTTFEAQSLYYATWEVVGEWLFDNEVLFALNKEQLKYKMNIKKTREPIVIYKENGISKMSKIPSSALGLPKNQVASWLSSHTSEEKLIVMNGCIKYLHILVRDRITYPSIAKLEIQISEEETETKYLPAYFANDYEYKDTIPSAQQHLVIPFLSVTKGLEGFVEYFEEQGLQIYGDYGQSTNLRLFQFRKDDYYNHFSGLLSNLQERYGYYIQSIFVTPYSELSNNLSYTSSGTYQGITFTGKLFKDYFVPQSSISSLVDDYDSRSIEEPTITFINKYKIETEYEVGNRIYQQGNDFLNGIMNALNYYFETWERKSINKSEKFTNVPKCLFDGVGVEYTGGVTINSLSKSSDNIWEDLIPCFIVGKKGFDDIIFEDTESRPIISFKNDYYEPILDYEPYSYFSFSFLESESSLQKRKLIYTSNESFENNTITRRFNVQLKYNQIVNAQYKFGLIPLYKSYVGGVLERFYNDALIYISSDSMTIRNNSFYDYTYQQNARMNSERYLTSLRGAVDMGKYLVNDVPYNIRSGATTGGWKGAIQGAGRSIRDVSNQAVDYVMDVYQTKLQQEAELSGAGAKADSYMCAGSDLMYDLNNDEYAIYFNKYVIDSISYITLAKTLERFGYKVDMYDNLNVDDRVGWNYIKLISFDFVEDSLKLSESQQSAIREIFLDGVTLMHNVSILNEEKHNYEVILEE